jgi:hypothetical protein
MYQCTLGTTCTYFHVMHLILPLDFSPGDMFKDTCTLVSVDIFHSSYLLSSIPPYLSILLLVDIYLVLW